jgi:hypothetical protein
MIPSHRYINNLDDIKSFANELNKISATKIQDNIPGDIDVKKGASLLDILKASKKGKEDIYDAGIYMGLRIAANGLLNRIKEEESAKASN